MQQLWFSSLYYVNHSSGEGLTNCQQNQNPKPGFVPGSDYQFLTQDQLHPKSRPSLVFILYNSKFFILFLLILFPINPLLIAHSFLFFILLFVVYHLFSPLNSLIYFPQSNITCRPPSPCPFPVNMTFPFVSLFSSFWCPALCWFYIFLSHPFFHLLIFFFALKYNLPYFLHFPSWSIETCLALSIILFHLIISFKPDVFKIFFTISVLIPCCLCTILSAFLSDAT